MQLRSWGRDPGSVFQLGEQSLSRRRRDNRGAVGADGDGVDGDGVWGVGVPSPAGEGFGEGV